MEKPKKAKKRHLTEEGQEKNQFAPKTGVDYAPGCDYKFLYHIFGNTF